MAVLKNPESSSLIIEIENGVDSKGSTTYKRKTFNNINVAASSDNVFAVAQAIAAVLEKGTRDFILKDTGKLINQA